MKKMLFLSQRIPYPPDKGDKIRSLNILRHFLKDYQVHLGSFIDDKDDWKYLEKLIEICTSVHMEALFPLRAKVHCLSGFLTGAPLSLPYYHNRALHKWVDKILSEVQPDVVFIYSSTMAQFVLGKNLNGAPLIMDFVDIDSDKWSQYAKTCSWPRSWIYSREGHKLLDYERLVARNADASIFVSPQEAAAFRDLAPESAERVHGVSNGIDSEFFSPQAALEPISITDGPLLTFTGAMDYWPNVDAVTWFANQILPRIRSHHSKAKFVIVGSNPTSNVLALNQNRAIEVTNRVPDVRPYIAHAAVSIAPIRIARGIQNKILEAMSMEKVVVTTSMALEGISAVADKEILVADTEEDFAARVLEMIADQSKAKKIGVAARQRAVADYSWPGQLRRLNELLETGQASSAGKRDFGSIN